MIELLLAVVFCVIHVVTVRRMEGALLAEQARVSELLRLLEAKAAPAEVAAFLHPHAQEADDRTYLVSDDGLVIVEVEDA